jgi:hypothetical protein
MANSARRREKRGLGRSFMRDGPVGVVTPAEFDGGFEKCTNSLGDLMKKPCIGSTSFVEGRDIGQTVRLG